MPYALGFVCFFPSLRLPISYYNLRGSAARLSLGWYMYMYMYMYIHICMRMQVYMYVYRVFYVCMCMRIM